MNNNKTKNIILAVLVVGLVGMTIAYASLTQTLVINNNQVTVSSNWRVRFGPTVTTSVGTTVAGTTTGASYTANTPVLDNDRQTIKDLQATFTKPGDYVEVAFRVQNEGNIAAKGELIAINLGNLTCKNGANSSIPQASLDTFCSKLTKWVRHSDGITEWSAADTLAAYSGSGDNYPHIDGILRIEYPYNTLSNSDIEAINGGSVVVTLGYTTLHFVQDDNAVAQSGGNEQSGGSQEQGGGSETPVSQTWNNFITLTQASGATLPDNSLIWIQENTTSGAKEVCEVFPSGTVCVAVDEDGYESDFQDCEDYETYTGSGSTCIKGYVKEKADEMLSKGAGRCDIFGEDWEMNCYNSQDETRYIWIGHDGHTSANLNSGFTRCAYDYNDEVYGCTE